MKKYFALLFLAVATVLGLASCAESAKDPKEGIPSNQELLHVSFDISRELFASINQGFVPYWTAQNPGSTVHIEQSHAGSSRQVRSVVDGLPADLVSMNNLADIQFLFAQSKDQPGGALIAENWAELYPNGASPFFSTMAFVVRKGNPKGIKEWSDLAKDGVNLVAPNYKTTGNGRYSYLTAWAWVLHQGGSTAEAKNLLTRIVKNTPVLATGGRDATTIFAERGQGDVLATFEAEANAIIHQYGSDKYEVIVPSFGLITPMYVVTVKKNTEAKAKSITAVANDYWNFVYSDAGQEIIAKSFYRPYKAEIAAKFTDILPPTVLVTIDSVFGSPEEAQKQHFAEGGSFDQIVAGK